MMMTTMMVLMTTLLMLKLKLKRVIMNMMMNTVMIMTTTMVMVGNRMGQGSAKERKRRGQDAGLQRVEV
eukprot:439425-Hanusia_phi.AAC.1